MTKHNQKGWGLTETLLTLGAMSAMALAIYAVLGPASASAQVKREQDNLRHLSSAVDRSWGLLGSFDGVSTARVLDDGLAPTRMRVGDDLRTAWGTGVGIHPYTVAAPPGTNNAFLVSYPLAPAEVCARLASAMSRDAHDIRVEGRSVYADGRLDPVIAAEQCGSSDAASMEFVFHSGLVSGQAVAAAPVVLPPPPPTITPPPASPPVITIPGAPPVDPVGPGAPAVPPPAAPVPPPTFPPSPTLPPAPITPPPPTFNPPPPPVSPPGMMCDPTPTGLPMQTQRRNCPVGQLGDIYEERTRTQHYTCPEAWGNPVPSHVVNGNWTEISRSCVAECVAPSPTSTPLSRAAPVQIRDTCPASHTGSTPEINTGTEAGTRTTSWTCPAPTGSPTSTTADTWSGVYSYNGWTANGPDTCAAPPPTTCGQWQSVLYSLAPNFGNLDGESVLYQDGAGGGCFAEWGGRSGITDHSAFNACRNSIPARPLAAGAYYELTEYTNYGGGMENRFGYAAPSVCPAAPSYTVDSQNCGQDSLCAPPGVWPSTWEDRAQAACAGAPAGSQPGTISWCEQAYIQCDVNVTCTGN